MNPIPVLLQPVLTREILENAHLVDASTRQSLKSGNRPHSDILHGLQILRGMLEIPAIVLDGRGHRNGRRSDTAASSYASQAGQPL